MAISKFYNDYSLKTNDLKNYLETYEDRIVAVSLFLGEGKFETAKKIGCSMIEQRYQPATPTFLNSGRANSGELVSCFLLEMDDSLNSINYNLSTAMQLSKLGGGIAINLSKLRSTNETIKGIENASSGIMPVLKLLEDAFSYVDQLGQRQGAGAAYLNIFHADVLSFLDTKKINADEKIRIKTLSIGLTIPDKFMELTSAGSDVCLFKPHTVYTEYGVHLDDMNMDEMYDKLVANPNVGKTAVSARDLMQRIAISQFESGYPYIVYIDAANRQNPLKEIGKIKISNLCTEIFQIQTTSTINDYEEKDEIGHDISCNLGSLNIVHVMEKKDIKQSVFIGMDALTRVSILSSIKNAPGIKNANRDYHSVGLGAMNLNGYLAKNKIPYESEDAQEFASVFFATMNYYSLMRSCQIAQERNETFLDFDKSEYANGNYFVKYFKNEFLPTRKRVKELFDGIDIPTPED